MVYRLEIENFYSIRDHQTVDLTVPLTTPENPERFAPLFDGADLRTPKVISIFGANGSGKSTVLKALAFLGWFVQHSFQYSEPGLPCERFNDEYSAKRPVRLAIEFGGAMELRRNVEEGKAVPQGVFRYELELSTQDGIVTSVNKEILRRKPEGRGKWLRVFKREAGTKLLGSTVFPLSGYAKVVDKIRGDASVMATLALFEHEPSQILVDAARKIFSNILIDKNDLPDVEIVKFLADSPNLVAELNKELQRIDVGIKELQIIQSSNGPEPYFKHDGLQFDMPWRLESHGTRSFIRMFPLLRAAMLGGGIAIIDELDLSIHPLILPELVRWFYDPERNPYNAQLWMTCQSASLMDELMKEEIVLCEKDRQGRSTIFVLTDMKAIRRSDNIYKKYLGGAYGAVPHIG